nr:hypothetical protein [Nocardia tenerifensis]
MGMELSASRSGEDMATLDAEVRRHGLSERSAAVHGAVEPLRNRAIEDAYEQAWELWSEGGEEQLWALAAADGLDDAPRQSGAGKLDPVHGHEVSSRAQPSLGAMTAPTAARLGEPSQAS